jgi:hypothetical protein
MKTLAIEDIIQMHIDKFGFEPVITGINFNDSLDTFERVLESIEDGIPYVEKEVPEGMLT